MRRQYCHLFILFHHYYRSSSLSYYRYHWVYPFHPSFFWTSRYNDNCVKYWTPLSAVAVMIVSALFSMSDLDLIYISLRGKKRDFYDILKHIDYNPGENHWKSLTHAKRNLCIKDCELSHDGTSNKGSEALFSLKPPTLLIIYMPSYSFPFLLFA